MKNFIPYTVILILCFLLFRQCEQTKKERISGSNTAEFLLDSVRFYKNKSGQEIAEKSVLIGNLEILLNNQIDSTQQLKKLVSGLRNVQTAGNITTITKIDTLEIAYEIPVEMPFERYFNLKNDHYSFSGISTHEKILFEEIYVPNTLSYAIHEKRGKYVISTTNSNPYIQTVGLDSYILQPKQKKIGVSLYTGYGINANFEASPQIGLGLSYTFFRL